MQDNYPTYNDTRLAQQLTGRRFQVLYRLRGKLDEARKLAEAICVEQTVEFPYEALPPGQIPAQLVGQIEDIWPVEICHGAIESTAYYCSISYAEELVGQELPQLLNTLFGNISMLDNIRLEGLKVSAGLKELLPGPLFGSLGIRKILGVESRPLMFSALKPVGLDATDLAVLVERLVLAGIDVIKDDHGIANQRFANFYERAARVGESVRKAEAIRGRPAIYVANITTTIDNLLERARLAKQLGVGGLMIAPGLIGFDSLRLLRQSGIDLPIFVHPAFSRGAGFNGADGIAPSFLYGVLPRLLGADATIFPNFGGRFPISRDDCLAIVDGCRDGDGGGERATIGRPYDNSDGSTNGEGGLRATGISGDMPEILPAPAGGMQLERIPQMIELYGTDLLVLIGGGLFTATGSLEEGLAAFYQAVAKYQ